MRSLNKKAGGRRCKKVMKEWAAAPRLEIVGMCKTSGEGLHIQANSTDGYECNLESHYAQLICVNFQKTAIVGFH